MILGCDDVDADTRRALGLGEPRPADRRAVAVRRSLAARIASFPPHAVAAAKAACCAPNPAWSSTSSPRRPRSRARSATRTQAAMEASWPRGGQTPRASCAWASSAGELGDHSYPSLVRARSSWPGGRLAAADRAAAWAGKPSWSARATIDGAMRRSAAASARATAVRFRNASAVMPDDTWAKPLRRQRRRAADHEVGGAERRVLADEDLAGVDERVDDARRRRRRRRRPAGARARSGWRPPTASSRSSRRARSRRSTPSDAAGRRRRARSGRSASWPASSASTASASAADVGDEHHRRVGAVLGLDQQVGGEADRVGACRRRSTTLSVGPSSIIVATPWRCISTWAMVTAGEPGPTTLRTFGIDSVPKPSAAMPAGPLTRNTSVDAELAAHDEHRRIDLAGAARDRRHDERRSRGTPATIAGTRQLVGDARVARLARRHEQPGRRDRRDLLADAQAGLGLEATSRRRAPAAAR